MQTPDTGIELLQFGAVLTPFDQEQCDAQYDNERGDDEPDLHRCNCDCTQLLLQPHRPLDANAVNDSPKYVRRNTRNQEKLHHYCRRHFHQWRRWYTTLDL